MSWPEPLHLACLHGKLDAARLLVGRDADVGAEDGSQATPLQLASENVGGFDLVWMLVQRFPWLLIK